MQISYGGPWVFMRLRSILFQPLGSNTYKGITIPNQQKSVQNVEQLAPLSTITQNNLVGHGEFTKRRKLGKRRYLTFRSKFSKPYDRTTLKLGTNL